MLDILIDRTYRAGQIRPFWPGAHFMAACGEGSDGRLGEASLDTEASRLGAVRFE